MLTQTMQSMFMVFYNITSWILQIESAEKSEPDKMKLQCPNRCQIHFNAAVDLL